MTIDFSGVISLVNSVGTISLDFPYPVRDDDLGNNNSGLQITHPGCQAVSGSMALALARSRYYQYYENGSWHGDPSSDLGRIERQNIVISAIIDKAKGDLNPIDLNRVLGAVVGDISKDPQLSGNAPGLLGHPISRLLGIQSGDMDTADDGRSRRQLRSRGGGASGPGAGCRCAVPRYCCPAADHDTSPRQRWLSPGTEHDIDILHTRHHNGFQGQHSQGDNDHGAPDVSHPVRPISLLTLAH